MMTSVETQPSTAPAKMTLPTLTAMVVGFLSVLAVFSLVTLLSYGILPRAELADLRQPSMASLMEYVVGHWGAVFISLGVVVSVLGAYLAGR
jgi:arginine:ornithine antiporter/lysine permease